MRYNLARCCLASTLCCPFLVLHSKKVIALELHIVSNTANAGFPASAVCFQAHVLAELSQIRAFRAMSQWWAANHPTVCTMRRLHPLRTMKDCTIKRTQQDSSSCKHFACAQWGSTDLPSPTEVKGRVQMTSTSCKTGLPANCNGQIAI